MSIGNVIRKYRKNLGLTQEEMANRLGVTAPAVNKWEKGNSQPDISLLAPIARLLHITTDTLLSFREELTEEELSRFVEKLNRKLESGPYAEAFAYAREKAETYPGCGKLLWSFAVILDAGRVEQGISDGTDYDGLICGWYLRALESEDYILRKAAASSLCSFYIRKEQYEKAEEYLGFFPEDDPERKRRQAYLYSRTGKKEEAFRAYESLLLSGFNSLKMVIDELSTLYRKEKDFCMAHRFAELERAFARLFEMGRFHEAAAGLELATTEKDVAKTEQIMRILLEDCDTMADFTRSDLYRHLYTSPAKAAPVSAARFQKELVQGFLDEEAYGYMRGNAYWEQLKKTEKKN